jgi:hypothetical protein
MCPPQASLNFCACSRPDPAAREHVDLERPGDDLVDLHRPHHAVAPTSVQRRAPSRPRLCHPRRRGVHDVVVIGAGPAGLSAAAELARTHDCLLVDLRAATPTSATATTPRHPRRHRRRRPVLRRQALVLAVRQRPVDPPGPGRPRRRVRPHRRPARPPRRRSPARTAPTPLRTRDPGAWHLKRYPSIYMSLPRSHGRDRRARLRLPAALDRRPRRRRGPRARSPPPHHRPRRHPPRRTHARPSWSRPVACRRGGSARGSRRSACASSSVASSSASRIESRCRLPAVPPARAASTPSSASATSTPRARPGPSACVATARSSSGRADLTTISAWSGRADGPPSGRSNLGLLVRTRDEALARAVLPALLTAPPRSLPLADLTDLDPLSLHFGPGAPLVRQALARLRRLVPRPRRRPRRPRPRPLHRGRRRLPRRRPPSPSPTTSGPPATCAAASAASSPAWSAAATSPPASPATLTTGSRRTRPRR